MMISSESLTNDFEGGAAGLFVIEDGQAFGGASLFFIGECDFVQLPFLVLDDVVELEGDIGDDKMIGQL
jgi:hypothetical protein